MNRRRRVLDAAIVGMSCRLPGVPDLDAFWDRAVAGLAPVVGPSADGDAESFEADPDRDLRLAALRDAGVSEGLGPVAAMSPLSSLRRGLRDLSEGRTDLAIAGDGGSGVVVLKRVERAERDGDRIYAVVKALGLARDDRRSRKPDKLAFAAAMSRAYRRSGIDPRSVEWIEGIGPGPSSGIVGLIAAALGLSDRALPGRPWIHAEGSGPRRAGVNLTGRAGLAGHVVMEEHSQSDLSGGSGHLLRWETEAVLLSGRDRTALLERVDSLLIAVEAQPDLALKDIASTLNADPNPGPSRLGLVARSTAELAEKLRQARPAIEQGKRASIRDQRGTYYREAPLKDRALAFIFPGEGSQYPGMLGDLCLHFPEVRQRLDIADRVALDSGSPMRPSSLLYGGRAGEGLWSVGPAVNVVLASQWALFGLLSRLGLVPEAVVGHSSGEFLAIAAAGAIRVDRGFEDAMGGLASAFERLESSRDLPEAGLLAIAAGRDRVESLIAGMPVAIAMDNCPHQVVVAGPPAAIASLSDLLKAEGLFAEPLPFSRAYHTPEFAPVVGPIRSLLASRVVSAPSMPIYSCASAGRMPEDRGAVVDLAVDQWSRPVRFRETIERMHADGLRVFVDVGARGHLAGFVDDILRGLPCVSLAANVPKRPGVTQINHLVASLFSLGFDLDTTALYERRRPSRLDLGSPIVEAGRLPSSGPENRSGEADSRFETRDSRLRGDEGAREARRIPLSNLESRISNPLPGVASGRDPGPDQPLGSATQGPLLDYLRTMDEFLATQREVMSAYLASRSEGDEVPTPGPWAGEVCSIVPGREVVAVLRLDAVGDPVATQHTLGGRRVSADDPGRLGLPVVPFAVMAEILAEAAALLMPGRELVALRDVRAHRWIRYEHRPIALEVRAVAEGDGRVRAAIYNRGDYESPAADGPPVVEGEAEFAAERPVPVSASPFALDAPRPCRFTAESLYGEQWLFHGPALQAVARVGEIAAGGIEGDLRVLPRGPLLRDPIEAAGLRIDPIILDNFTHLLGCWGLDELAERGDVIFPLRMGELALFGDAPPDGDLVSCRVRIDRLEHRRVGVWSEIVRGDGTVWLRISGWEDWRFHWPGRYRDVMRRPEIELLGEPLPLPGVDPATASAAWLRPPEDFGRPVWRDVLEQVQLSREEKAEVSALPESSRTGRIWGLVAAKEAARRLLLNRGADPIFPADLPVVIDPTGRSYGSPPAPHPGWHAYVSVDMPPGNAHLPVGLPSSLDEEESVPTGTWASHEKKGGPTGRWAFPGGEGRPSGTRASRSKSARMGPDSNSMESSTPVGLAMAHSESVAVALATTDATARPGIAVMAIEYATGRESRLTTGERRLLDLASRDGDRDGWVARLVCARDAARESSGRHAEIVGIGPGEGVVLARYDDGEAARVVTARRDDHAWAWTLGERSDPR